MKKTFLRILVFSLLPLLFTSCIKNNVTSLGDGGSSFLKVTQAPTNSIFFAPFSNIQNATLLTARRDVATNAELNTPISFKFEVSNDSITKYNTTNGSSFAPLPDSLFTLGSGVTRSGNIYTLTLNAGEFQKDLVIGINGAKWDLSKTYALAFKVVDSAGLKIASGNKNVIALISIKNKWDGVYKVTAGTMVDYTSATLGHINTFLSSSANTTGVAAPMQYELRTISSTKCDVYDNYFFGGYETPITSGTTYSKYGTFGLTVEFDPTTDKIIAVTNHFGQPAANTRSAQLDATGLNTYSASSKTIQIKYNMLQPSVVTAAPYIRTHWEETWTYFKSR